MGQESQAFIYFTGAIAVGMLIWNTIEVGRNDAANIVNAVFGARVMSRRLAVLISGLAVIAGAIASSDVMETARKGIFDPNTLPTVHEILSVYIAVYLTNTVLLYSFSAFGMPVSTTACLVFALLGGGVAMGGADAVNWGKSSQVIAGIIWSIVVSGIMGFLIQRAFRGAIGKDCDDLERIHLHGPWVAGALMTGLVYFLLMKGMQNMGFVQALRGLTIDALGAPAVLAVLWAALSLLAYMAIRIGGSWAAHQLFPGLAVLGMIATAIAFGQNDLANCASPGLASFLIIWHGKTVGSTMDVPWYLLLGCGLLLFLGMNTRNAQRVTRAAVNTGSQGDVVRLYAPQWCIRAAKWLVPEPHPHDALAPEPALTERQKLQHYDALRAAVITSVSGSVIAFASGMGLPVSTTYVAFAAVVATGWADQIFLRGDAQLKMGRTIWVVFCWFFSAGIAAIAAGLTAKLVSIGGTVGIAIGLAVNLTIQTIMRRRADRQENRLRQEAHTNGGEKILGEVSTHRDIMYATEADSDEN